MDVICHSLLRGCQSSWDGEVYLGMLAENVQAIMPVCLYVRVREIDNIARRWKKQ